MPRTDLLTAGGPQVETFSYDALDRISAWSISGKGNVAFAYDVLGNLTDRVTTKSTGLDVEKFQYTGIDASGRPVGPHALTNASYGEFSYDAAGQQIAAPGRNVDFTAIGLPRRVSTSGLVSEFVYDAFQDRAEKRSASGSTVYVGGLYEKRTSSTGTEHVFLVAGGERTVAHVKWFETAIGTTKQTSYLHDERQGHVTTVTDGSGAISERFRFDPYGRRVDPDDPLVEGTAPTSVVRLGFTSHEHEDELGLVNMNGRMYDPRQMRFISPDPVVADPTRTQAYNRYAYVMDNPTRYTDPSGYQPVPDKSIPNEDKCEYKELGPANIGIWECTVTGTPVVDDNGQSSPEPTSKPYPARKESRGTAVTPWFAPDPDPADIYRSIDVVDWTDSRTVNEILAGGAALWNGLGWASNLVPKAAAGVGIAIDAFGDLMGNRQAAHDLSWLVGAGEVEAFAKSTAYVLQGTRRIAPSFAFLFTGAGGGAFFDIRAPLRERHEMPSAAALKASEGFHPFTARLDAPAVSMDPTHHLFTPSHGAWGELARDYSAAQAQMIREGRLLDAMMLDVQYIRDAYPGIYEAEIQAYCEYVWSVLAK